MCGTVIMLVRPLYHRIRRQREAIARREASDVTPVEPEPTPEKKSRKSNPSNPQ